MNDETLENVHTKCFWEDIAGQMLEILEMQGRVNSSQSMTSAGLNLPPQGIQSIPSTPQDPLWPEANQLLRSEVT